MEMLSPCKCQLESTKILPWTLSQEYQELVGIWVIVDRIINRVLFQAIRENTSLEKLEKLYMDEVVRLHGVPISIVSDRDARFTSRFCKYLQEVMGMRINSSTSYHL